MVGTYEKDNIIYLSKTDSLAFINAIKNPKEPNDHLKTAIISYNNFKNNYRKDFAFENDS